MGPGGIHLRGLGAIASARATALADPEDETLTRCLAEIEAQGSASIAAA